MSATTLDLTLSQFAPPPAGLSEHRRLREPTVNLMRAQSAAQLLAQLNIPSWEIPSVLAIYSARMTCDDPYKVCVGDVRSMMRDSDFKNEMIDSASHLLHMTTPEILDSATSIFSLRMAATA